jgi:hypothetical protein
VDAIGKALVQYDQNNDTKAAIEISLVYSMGRVSTVMGNDHCYFELKTL